MSVDATRCSFRVRVHEDALTVDLADGLSIAVPLAWYPRVVHAVPAERPHWRLIGRKEARFARDCWIRPQMSFSVMQRQVSRPETSVCYA